MDNRKVTWAEQTHLRLQSHPTSTAHTIIIATTRAGRVYASSWAGEPTQAEIHDAWTNGRRHFKPYDESRGCYLA